MMSISQSVDKANKYRPVTADGIGIESKDRKYFNGLFVSVSNAYKGRSIDQRNARLRKRSRNALLVVGSRMNEQGFRCI
jgi:hypothetical protein